LKLGTGGKFKVLNAIVTTPQIDTISQIFGKPIKT